jgi:putative sigma-54 modulation protein
LRGANKNDILIAQKGETEPFRKTQLKEADQMIIRFNTKDAHVPESILETMERRTHQRLDAYFKDEAPEATVIYVRIAEQKNLYRVEMTMPYMGYTLRTENREREISLPALDKGIDILERQMKKVRTRLSRDLRKKPEIAEAAEAPAAEEPEELGKVVRVKKHAGKPMTVEDAILEMNLLGHNFYMFNNIETGKAATVYRRNDGDCGLIELENL